MDLRQKLKGTGCFGKKSRRRKKDYGDGGILIEMFNASKTKLRYTINKHGILSEVKFWKVIIIVKYY